MAPITKIPPIAHRIAAVATITLRLASSSVQRGLTTGIWAVSGSLARRSCRLRQIRAATIRPGTAEIVKTQCQEGTICSSCVATIGAKPSPMSGIMLSCRPRFSPRRDGREASLLAARLAGVNAPSATPITARRSIRLRKPEASPERLESNEKAIIVVTRIFFLPMRSDRGPIAMDHSPQATPSTPIRLPSCE
ncbi:hypothetical protein R69608_07940 [Paraburkholderia nemoris]|uniref:Uncharacterized protein n=1 Tax=Paraburkholderia nemoris TaxID=2793076 RepID=A0ABN7NH22_9BURK|nr:hypothetical protein R69619_07866 [Paraburkholderia nemoris]CAE6862527.1 hypothetical protein R75777_08100 [Paraburkholderia nemoris]CAE6865305.1 hypothetical protein R69776_08221 [Paraburkholderia nemoris]CAE6907980.1 hypothetical protein R69749_08498 [Paraburkholderia domus]CAE6973330.1 hypothetical protein R69608_07940 [Paraburkholderia nemoris]